MRLARRNRHPKQREVSAGRPHAFMYQVRAWYTALALGSYHADVRGALARLVTSVGTGPWLAGLWWGDSQLALLATWIGHAIAQPTWAKPLPLDYYLYSTFTENPANQCFVLGRAACAACLRRCETHPLPPSAYWLPDWALLRQGGAKACAGFEGDCGDVGLQQLLSRHATRSAGALWASVEHAFGRPRPDSSAETRLTVFDALDALSKWEGGAAAGGG